MRTLSAPIAIGLNFGEMRSPGSVHRILACGAHPVNKALGSGLSSFGDFRRLMSRARKSKAEMNVILLVLCQWEQGLARNEAQASVASRSAVERQTLPVPCRCPAGALPVPCRCPAGALPASRPDPKWRPDPSGGATPRNANCASCRKRRWLALPKKIEDWS